MHFQMILNGYMSFNSVEIVQKESSERYAAYKYYGIASLY